MRRVCLAAWLGMAMAILSQRLLAITLSATLPIASAWAQSQAGTDARNLSLEQQTKIADVITRRAGSPLAGGHFSLAIGNTLPPDVALHPVPPGVESVAPQFKEASYVVVEEQIAIVDSKTRKILAVIQRGVRQGTGSTQAH